MEQTKKRAWIPYLMVLPAFSVMVLVVVLPILNTVRQSFRTAEGAFTLSNYQYFLQAGRRWKV